MPTKITESELLSIVEEMATKVIKEQLQPVVDELVKESLQKESKCPKGGCIKKKPNGKWGVISGKTGKFWDADYETREDAEAGLRGYFANK